jgi:hypothetical protein
MYCRDAGGVFGVGGAKNPGRPVPPDLKGQTFLALWRLVRPRKPMPRTLLLPQVLR